MSTTLKIYISLGLFLILSLFPLLTKAQTPADAMAKIRESSSLYKIGEASADNENDARNASLENLLMQLRTTFSLDRKETERESTEGYDYKSESEIRASSIMTVENLNTLIYQDNKGWHAMSYISNNDLAEAERQRIENIKDLIELAQEQEGKLNIAGALKYYTWALNMLSAFGDNITMNIEGKDRNAKAWLTKHIPMILDNIEISISDNAIVYDDFDYDHYSVNIDLKYADKPVSALDLSYFNGQKEVKPVHGKNGKATLAFPDLSNFRELTIKILYDYPEEGKLYDPELKSVYEAGKRANFGNKDNVKLPIKIKAETIKANGPARNDDIMAAAKHHKQNLASAASAENPETQPILGTERKQIDRPEVNDVTLFAIMQQVEKALRTRKYDEIKGLFTDEGWSIFSLMTSTGDVKVVKKDIDYSVEKSNLFTIGKGIPISIKTAGHISNETLVFRFDKDSSLISSIAYALTKRAEDDIFRQAQWNMESRYSLLTFMEDYQTAFALKRLDYIEKIFSDNAIIITGKITPDTSSKKFFDAKTLGYDKRQNNVVYRQFNKDQYINQLKNDFFDKRSKSYKKYIQLTFEDAVISKVASNGYTDNEIMWIEIKQQYNSNSYSDKGYLTLQIDLKPKGSQIHIRTWTPDFIDLDFLKRRFNIGG